MFDFLSNTAIVGLLTSVLTGVITYVTTRSKNQVELSIKREELIDQHLQNILEGYKQEISALRAEVHELTEENKKLVAEILGLKAKIYELEEKRNVK
ncbi:hypothetical protein [Clostridium felsineum]|uniref:hypothetical protein n=1 Tax=Clostridium felsineum TaxID=36839 RepID=UPI00098C68C8|nr:hypothetical protein [Clostridium felsineum]URZ16853.1 hypothetical protein CLFE_029000 [Clostridium felsineum DSM 794]